MLLALGVARAARNGFSERIIVFRREHAGSVKARVPLHRAIHPERGAGHVRKFQNSAALKNIRAVEVHPARDIIGGVRLEGDIGEGAIETLVKGVSSATFRDQTVEWGPAAETLASVPGAAGRAGGVGCAVTRVAVARRRVSESRVFMAEAGWGAEAGEAGGRPLRRPRLTGSSRVGRWEMRRSLVGRPGAKVDFPYGRGMARKP